MIDISHNAIVGFAKSFGLFYLVLLSVGICIYVFWPRNRDRFNRAKHSIFDDEDGPSNPEDQQ